jgi:hypothetical protein
MLPFPVLPLEPDVVSVVVVFWLCVQFFVVRYHKMTSPTGMVDSTGVAIAAVTPINPGDTAWMLISAGNNTINPTPRTHVVPIYVCFVIVVV